METLMAQIARQRKTEEKVRSMDAEEIVDWIHSLEDEIEKLKATTDFVERSKRQ